MDYLAFKSRLDPVSSKSYEWPNKFFFEDRAWILRALFLVALLLLVVVPILMVVHPQLILYCYQR